MEFQASKDEILQGKTTDIYFDRAKNILQAEGKNPEVTMKVWAKHLPEDYKWAIFTGLGEVLELLESRKVTVRSLSEGSKFLAREPVMIIRGKYLEFGMLETPLLGYICQASGISTRSARCKISAGEKTVLSFGARRMHPSITPVIDRYAYLGGLDGVSAVLSGEKMRIQPQGTIPHAVILILGDTLEASRAYDRSVPEDVPRIILVDTFMDEKVESLRLAEELKDKLDAVRIDTPYSRRGDFPLIAEEIREELDSLGYQNVEIFASGGINEKNIPDLNPWVDGYGVGTSISNAPTINFSMDIVEIEGNPITKKGQVSGDKEVFECMRCGNRKVLPAGIEHPACECGTAMEKLLRRVMENGNITEESSIEEIRKRVMNEMRFLNV